MKLQRSLKPKVAETICKRLGFTLGASVWLVSFAFGAVSTIIEHGFELATNIFGG